MRDILTTLAEILGLCIIALGIAEWSRPAAIVVLGVGLVGAAYVLSGRPAR